MFDIDRTVDMGGNGMSIAPSSGEYVADMVCTILLQPCSQLTPWLFQHW